MYLLLFSIVLGENRVVYRRYPVAVIQTGVTRVALIKRTLNDRYVLEIEGDRAELLREGERPSKSFGTRDSDTGDIVAANNWTRILLR